MKEAKEEATTKILSALNGQTLKQNSISGALKDPTTWEANTRLKLLMVLSNGTSARTSKAQSTMPHTLD